MTQKDPSAEPAPVDPIASSSEAPIDVVRMNDDGDVDSSMDSLTSLTNGNPANISSSTDKNKSVEAVLLDPEAMKQLNGFGRLEAPAIGLLHGVLLDQGIALINHISRLPRYLCTWSVQPQGELQFENVLGAVILESVETDLTYQLTSLKNILPPNNPVFMKIHIFKTSEDQLVMKGRCSLLNVDPYESICQIPVYKVGHHEIGYSNFESTFESELNQAFEVMQRPKMAISCMGKLMEHQSTELISEAKRLNALNVNHHLDRVLLELRSNISKRINELECNWLAKRAKSSEGESQGKKDVNKFRQHLQQSVLKDFASFNTLLSQVPPLHNGPYHLPSIQVKSSKPASASVTKKRASPKAKKTTDAPIEVNEERPEPSL